MNRKNLIQVLWYLKICAYCVPYMISYFIPRNDNIWIFGYNSGKGFTDNSKHLFLYTSENCENIRPIWITEQSTVVEELTNAGYEAYEVGSLKATYFSLIAQIVIVTHSLHDVIWWCTGGSQIVRLNHGIPFKKSHWANENEVNDFDIFKRTLNKYIFWNYDYTIAPSREFVSKAASMAGVSENNVLVTGLPRTDAFFEPNYDPYIGPVPTIAEDRDWLEDNTIIFYFRTWRDNGDTPEDHYDLDALHSVLEDNNSYLLWYEHANSNTSLTVSEYDRIIGLSIKSDFYPIIMFSDIVATDYSSLLFDYLLTGSPILYYQYDIDEFESARSLFFNPSSLPGDRATDFVGFLDLLEDQLQTGRDRPQNGLKEWRETVFGSNYGTCCKQAVEQISNKIT